MITLKEITESREWEQSEKGNFPLTQTFAYGEVQIKMGRKIKRFDICSDSKSIGFIQIVEYPLFGKYVYWYAPYGPVIYTEAPTLYKGLKEELKRISKGLGVVFIRLDFTPVLSESMVKEIGQQFTLAPKASCIGAYFQPRGEWYTDISKTLDEILAQMHSKTRYSVRLAEKKGIEIKMTESSLKNRLPDFLKLMKLTAERNKFHLHNNDYYEKYFEEMEKMGKVFIVEGFYNGELLASHFVVIVGDVAHYVFGSSSNDKRELCAPYLVHYRAMLKAKELCAKYYNFGAVSLGDTNDGWESITVFKQKFGGGTVLHSPLFDLVLKPVWYYIYVIRKVIKSYQK